MHIIAASARQVNNRDIRESEKAVIEALYKSGFDLKSCDVFNAVDRLRRFAESVDVNTYETTIADGSPCVVDARSVFLRDLLPVLDISEADWGGRPGPHDEYNIDAAIHGAGGVQ